MAKTNSHGIDGFNTDAELISELARELEITPTEAKKIIEAFVNSLRHCIRYNGFANIRKLGLFQTKDRKRTKRRNVQTGEWEDVALMHVVKFRPAISLRNLINEGIRGKLFNG